MKTMDLPCEADQRWRRCIDVASQARFQKAQE